MKRDGRSIAEPVSVTSGRLSWARDGNDLVTGPYRIQMRTPAEWQVLFGDRLVDKYERRSMALAWAEHHHREQRRKREIKRWTMSAAIALMVAAGALSQISERWFYFFVFAGCFGVFLNSLARALASASRNLLDPYRTREKWEPRDWWICNP